jgi:hypothetical protein
VHRDSEQKQNAIRLLERLTKKKAEPPVASDTVIEI